MRRLYTRGLSTIIALRKLSASKMKRVFSGSLFTVHKYKFTGACCGQYAKVGINTGGIQQVIEFDEMNNRRPVFVLT